MFLQWILSFLNLFQCVNTFKCYIPLGGQVLSETRGVLKFFCVTTDVQNMIQCNFVCYSLQVYENSDILEMFSHGDSWTDDVFQICYLPVTNINVCLHHLQEVIECSIFRKTYINDFKVLERKSVKVVTNKLCKLCFSGK